MLLYHRIKNMVIFTEKNLYIIDKITCIVYVSTQRHVKIKNLA